MLIWTVIPEELVFSGLEEVKREKEVVYRGRRLLVSPLPEGKMCIMRVISSNPRDFMDPRFQPGTVINGPF